MKGIFDSKLDFYIKFYLHCIKDKNNLKFFTLDSLLLVCGFIRILPIFEHLFL